ncbi:carbohydrate ABC transporter permease [Isoptericola croceus]|uniref:carbohydrate ABC transporter permease n=1 Tax=Isoptericola croceus TaxID=3031406 RepID=UPI0023F8037F|nr:sugar ABC transporter permease [Isoptericola croceus]
MTSTATPATAGLATAARRSGARRKSAPPGGGTSRLHRNEQKWALGFVALPVLGYLLFILYPVLFALYASLTRWNGLGAMEFIGLQNYANLLTDDRFHQSMWNTIFYLVGIPIGLAISLALALAMNRRLVGLTVFRTIYYIPVICSIAAVAILWQWAYNGDFGLVNQFLGLLGIDGPNWLADATWSKPAITLMMVWKGLGYSMLLYLAAIQAVPRSLMEAAELDGAGAWQRFRAITLPMVRPVTFFLVVTQIIASAQIFAEIQIMTPGGGPEYSTASAVFHIWRQAFQYQQMGYATAMAIVLGILIFIITLIQFRLNKRSSFVLD